ncbi:MAG: hypothetical protein KIT16_13590 [Rhodospirillaceae bacterium]|nr:hypothetical protein [Rhodospirillaceae bacterium]
MIKRLGFAVLTALVAGCASDTPPAQQWTKRDATPEDIRSALFWCSHAERDRPRALGTPADNDRQTRQIVDDECMQKRGFTKAEPQK